jgi:hypothetical protein
LLALLGPHPILHVSRVRVKQYYVTISKRNRCTEKKSSCLKQTREDVVSKEGRKEETVNQKDK